MPKNVKGDPFGFINIHSVAKYQKTQKNFEKKLAQSRTKWKGDPLVSSGFVGYVEKVKNERETLCTKFPLAGLSLSGFSNVSKKWTD